MRLLTFLPTLGLVGQAIAVSHSCYAQSPPGDEVPSDKDVREYFTKLVPATKSTLLHDTTGPEAGADVGVVTAAIPDRNHPESSVYRLRDACHVYHAWINELTVLGDKSLRPMADDLTHALIRTQQAVGLAGNVFTGGIEEVVFDVKINPNPTEASRFGSPAADGPPFRANTLIKYAEWLIEPEQNNGTWVTDVLWPKINLDLQWIALHWNQSSWDIWWPPAWGGSYWAASMQYRALRNGARLGRAIDRGVDVVDGFESQASIILAYMQTFWNEKEGFMTETTTTNIAEGRSGYGSAPLMMSVYNFDPSLGCDDVTFQPCSPRALSSLKVVGDHFKEFFPISQNFTDKQPPFFGLYTEERFLGGHPQFFSTFNSAEQLYDALITWDLVGQLKVTSVDLKFWRQFDPKVKAGTYKKGSDMYKQLTDAAREWANKIVLQLAANTPKDYVLVEGINKEKGGPYGPRGMIRSLGAALGAYDAYNGLVPPNWGHPIPKNIDDEDVFAWSDEVVEWDDDEYRGADPTLYRERPQSPQRSDDMARYHRVF